jgi:K(+)-stimulated pyrophosphate-energized sodium pump
MRTGRQLLVLNCECAQVRTPAIKRPERNHTIVELSLISFISLLTVCSAALLFTNNFSNSLAAKVSTLARRSRRTVLTAAAALAGLAFSAAPAFGQHQGGEANLVLPDLRDVTFFGGINGHNLLLVGLVVCLLGLLFGLAIYMNLKKLPVHRAMRKISELIYETCKTYLVTQGKFILILEIFIGIIIILYFGVLSRMEPFRVAIILAFSLVGIAGSYGVAWFGIRVNTFANSRTAFASLEGKPFPLYAIPLKAGMSIGMMLISVELLIMLCILLFIPGDYAGPCFIGFAIGESLGAAALRIAGGIFTKIADIGSDLMKIVFKIKEDDARNPGVIADCTGDNAGDSVGPSADGVETPSSCWACAAKRSRCSCWFGSL